MHRKPSPQEWGRCAQNLTVSMPLCILCPQHAALHYLGTEWTCPSWGLWRYNTPLPHALRWKLIATLEDPKSSPTGNDMANCFGLCSTLQILHWFLTKKGMSLPEAVALHSLLHVKPLSLFPSGLIPTLEPFTMQVLLRVFFRVFSTILHS